MLLTGKSVRARARGLRFASVFLLAVQTLSFGHLLLVHHVTCPEHGEVIHTSHGTATLAGRANPATTRAVQPSTAASEPSEGADHDHCLACVESSRRTVLSDPVPALSNHAFVISVAGATRAAFFAPIDLILLSPKSSPPSV